eukprot:15469394-Alexandrium_andersonii.AAC.1
MDGHARGVPDVDQVGGSSIGTGRSATRIEERRQLSMNSAAAPAAAIIIRSSKNGTNRIKG